MTGTEERATKCVEEKDKPEGNGEQRDNKVSSDRWEHSCRYFCAMPPVPLTCLD